ncbi:MAG: hypothetical protein WAN87_01300 [Thermoplasmata archaeon]
MNRTHPHAGQRSTPLSVPRARSPSRVLVPLLAVGLIFAFLVPMLLIFPSSAAQARPANSGVRGDLGMYTFTINESGLPTGWKWTGTFMGNHTNSNKTSISWPVAPGTYNWSVLPTSFTIGGTAWPEYAPSPARGTIHIIATSESVNVVFMPAWTITLSETGLPTGTNWSSRILAYGSTPETIRYSTNANVHYPLANGTYSFQVLNVNGAYGVKYVPTISDYGPIKLKGKNLTETVVFNIYYTLNTFSSPVAGGTATPTNGSFLAATVVQIGEGPANGYLFSSWVGTGSGSYTGPNDSANVTMNSPINETAEFVGATFDVTFTETGLPSGTMWAVTLNGSLESSGTSTIVFSEVNNTYAFNVSAVAGYTVSPMTGSVMVSGAAVPQAVVFSVVVPPSYNVTFTQSGLTSGTSWSVTLGGSLMSSSTATVVFSEESGSYLYTVGAVAGYTANPASGNIAVNGGPAFQTIVFTPPATFALTFTETGLSAGTSWSVTVNGATQSSTTTSIVFTEANGSYTFTPNNVTGFTVFPLKGTVVIQGQGATEAVTYSISTTGSGASSGLSTLDWVVILVVILAIVAAIVAVLTSRGRKPAPVVQPEQNPKP